MAKMLSQNDWNFNNIGTKFELDEDVLIPIKSLVGNTM